MKDLGKVFKHLRQKQRLTLKGTAALLHLSITAYWKIEVGVTDINMGRLAQIADLFKRDVVEVINLARYGVNHVSLDNWDENSLKAEAYRKNGEILSLQTKLIAFYDAERNARLATEVIELPLWVENKVAN